MELSGKTVAVLAENLYHELELWYPVLRMREAGATVVLVGTGSSETYAGKHGFPVKVDTTADRIRADQIDCLIVPGGYAPDLLRQYESVLSLVRETNAQGKVVAAICHAGWVLASAGILKGRKATSVLAVRDDVVHAGAEYVDSEVVVDGNLVTSRTPADLPAFCRTIIAAVSAQ